MGELWKVVLLHALLLMMVVGIYQQWQYHEARVALMAQQLAVAQAQLTALQLLRAHWPIPKSEEGRPQ